MAITLYHDVPSSNSDRVKIALAEKAYNGQASEFDWLTRNRRNPNF